MESKEIQVRCRNLLNEYEELLKFLVGEEEASIMSAIGQTRDNDPMTMLKKISYQQGIIEGARRLVARIYKHAHGN